MLLVSQALFNRGPAELVIVLPVTSTHRRIPSHVPIAPPEGGLKVPSDILCDAVRSIARERLLHPLGRVSPATLAAVEDRLRMLLDL